MMNGMFVIYIIMLVIPLGQIENHTVAAFEENLPSHSSFIKSEKESDLSIVQLLDTIAANVRILADSVSYDYPFITSIADSTIKNLEFLKKSWKKGTNNLKLYKKNLELILMTLKSRKEYNNNFRIFKIIQIAGQDIKIKTEFCRTNSVGPGEVVKIKVRTKKGMSEVSGWQVVYFPQIMRFADNQKKFTFPKLSPTSEYLAPGIYRIWAQKPGTKIIGKPMEIKVGSSKELIYDLPVPDDN